MSGKEIKITRKVIQSKVFFKRFQKKHLAFCIFFDKASLIDEHFRIYNYFFPLKSQRKNILTNQMKNKYFQANLEKRIKITR